MDEMRNTVVLLKHFTYEMMQLTRQTVERSATMPRPASDRNQHSLTYAATTRRANVRLPRAELLLKAKYAVKTQPGISIQSYSFSDEDPLYGEGQGTRWATAAWVLISTLIISLMPQRQTAFQIPTNPDHQADWTVR
jgi:hypothetical protein